MKTVSANHQEFIVDHIQFAQKKGDGVSVHRPGRRTDLEGSEASAFFDALRETSGFIPCGDEIVIQKSHLQGVDTSGEGCVAHFAGVNLDVPAEHNPLRHSEKTEASEESSEAPEAEEVSVQRERRTKRKFATEDEAWADIVEETGLPVDAVKTAAHSEKMWRWDVVESAYSEE